MPKNYFRFLTLFVLILLSSAVNAQAKESVIRVNYVRNSDNSVTFKYEKTKPGTYKIKIKFNDLVNTDSKDFEELVSNYSGSLMTLRPENPKATITFGYSVSYIFGNSKPVVDSLFHYTLPFKKGKSYLIYESGNVGEKYLGTQKANSWKSYFITSKSPDTICAMRKGIIVDVINEFATDTLVTGYVYSSRTNAITIEHEDGTYATYRGFKKNSFFVELGETVYPETDLGILDKFNNKVYNLHFNIHYIRNNYYPKPGEGLKTAKTAYDYLTPYFYTKGTVVKIIPKNNYTADCTPEIITKEMTKKELKMFLKKK